MNSKDLQRVTDCVSYIGQPFSPRPLPSGRNHVTQKVRIADQRTLYISMHDNPFPAEIFLRVKGVGCTPDTIALYVLIARLMSVALRYGASLEKLNDLLTGAKFTPCGPVSGHDPLKYCFSLPELVGRHLLVEYCGRDELAHVPRVVTEVFELQEAQP